MELTDTPVQIPASVAEPSAALLVRGHRAEAQEIVDRALDRGYDLATALRHAGPALRAGRRARVQYRAELYAETA